MKRSTLLLLLSLTLLLLFVAVFALLDFRLQRAEMGVNSNASTYAFGTEPEGAVSQARALDLYVRAPAFVEAELIQALQEALATNPYVGAITLHEMPPAPGAESVLVVTMEDPQTFRWTPVYAQANLIVDVAYASDGAVDWIGQKVVSFTSDDKPAGRVVRVRGEYTFANTAYGLLSRPGYAHYLAGEMGQTVNEALAATLADQQGALSQQ